MRAIGFHTTVLAFLVLGLLMAGCTSTPPAQNITKTTPGNVTNVTVPTNGTIPVNETNVTMIISQQQNQTVQQQQNYTNPAPPVESKAINYTFEPNDTLAIYFIYVGDQTDQGDAILIKKGDLNVLVDAGPVQNGGTVVDFLRTLDVSNVAVMLSTNEDPMHYGGISAVAAAFPIQEFWWSGETFKDPTYAALGPSMAGMVKTVRNVSRGFNMSLNGIEFTVLNPGPVPFYDPNNDAVVLRIQDRGFCAVLLSGTQFGAQNELLNDEGGQLDCDVMQAPYYGLGPGTSGIANFLKTTNPQLMVISGGPNESGGSRDPFRALLDEDNINYIENYANGGATVQVEYDGQSCSYGYLGGASQPC
jgi:beta-lactamase superfamily II metal-dependent hydrolase